MRPRHLRAAAATAAVLMLQACGGGGVQDSITPPSPPVDTSKTPVVQRTSLSVRVVIDGADAETARQAQVTGVGVTVRLARTGGSEPVRELVANTDGVVEFRDLLEGLYEVTVARELSAAERNRLTTLDDRDINLLAGGSRIVVSPPTAATLQVSLTASRRGSLAISEMYAWIPIVGQTFYNYAHYIEVANLADTTVYLDGIMLVRTYPQQHAGTPESGYCSNFATFRTDSTALWVSQIYRYPGAGREFPLRPGQFTVWAMDAINHGALIAGAPDLSRAQFEEIGGPADVDNPAAVKMVRLTKGSDVVTHGYPMVDSRITALVLPIARDTLGLERRLVSPSSNVPVWRIPREAVLDVAALSSTVENYTGTGAYRGGYRYCDPFIATAHDRALGQWYDSRANLAIRRRSLGSTASGVPILQRTRTSARDFELAEPLRRSLNR